jgi:hypothetical protein
MAKKKLLKPKYLSLDDQSKQSAIENIVASNPEETTKSLAKECMVFTDELEKILKDPAAKFQAIKKLFDIHVENLKKLNPAQ